MNHYSILFDGASSAKCVGKKELVVINFEHKNKEIGMCSEGAAVNRAVYNQLADERGSQYLSMFCLSLKLELALNDAFQISKQ